MPQRSGGSKEAKAVRSRVLSADRRARRIWRKDNCREASPSRWPLDRPKPWVIGLRIGPAESRSTGRHAIPGHRQLRAARIVRFDSHAPDRAEVVVSSETELQFPSETESGLAYWAKRCDGPKDRYRAHDPMVRLPGEGKPHNLGRSYGFRMVGPTFFAGGKPFANAEFADDFNFHDYDVLNREDTNGFGVSILPTLELRQSRSTELVCCK